MLNYLNVEFYRNGYGMLVDPNDKDPGSPICFPQSVGGHVLTGNCNCRKSKKGQSCRHFSELIRLVLEIEKKNNQRSLGDLFAASLWYRLAAMLSEGDAMPCIRIKAGRLKQPSGNDYIFTSQQDAFIARLLDDSAASLRFLDRAGLLPQQKAMQTRADILQRIAAVQYSKEEQLLNKAGVFTNRQSAELSFWGRLAYHAFCEYGDVFTFHPVIDQRTGDFTLRCFNKKFRILELVVPRIRVRKVLALLAREFPGQSDLAIHPIPLKSIFRVTQNTKLDIEVRPVIQTLQASGEAKFFDREDFSKFRYGDLVYIKEMNVLAELEHPESQRRFANPVSMNLKKSQLPSFLEEHQADVDEGNLVLDGPLKDLSIFREFDRMEIALDTFRRSWYWLSIRYGLGNETITLAEVLKARREGKSYLETQNGWIHIQSEAFRALEQVEQQDESANAEENGAVPISAMNLVRLLSSFDKPVLIKGKEDRANILKRLLDLAPIKPWRTVKGMTTSLRPYQIKGVDWLRFLFENQLGGLLCDDMGLGKTHQAMALMVWLKEKQKIKEPFLVVCPTTVISHWQHKIQAHAPGLKSIVYHGGDRKIDKGALQRNVLLTSYGIMRNDILMLREIPFSLVVFDEIQNLKNRDTQNYQASALLQAHMRIGLTGTPIENAIQELKSLFDLVLPGYMGSDEEFSGRYAIQGENAESSPGLMQLRKSIAPFTLRRLKKDVLEELPEKIEDVRTCQLSEAQVALYREAISTKGASLVAQLQSSPRKLPYIHIFALLNLLKRICDHPALALNKVEDYQSFESGKWELFQELLFETLDSGQKIVVFTQYLGMIAMMERLLANLGIPFVALTGASENRGEIVRRFNEDRDCRVFLGSLKAGGTGIDLVGGSTVLHYDRWWNAAREDQATDRVYRIGQKQAVQVFKLVTEGTLEEKISAIIERKRRLMNAVVQADNPNLGKIFTREELMDLLRPV
jgi:SNF2 family DNA or RNA helicase